MRDAKRTKGNIMPVMAAPRPESEPLNIQLLVDSIPALIHTARPDGYLDYFNKPWLEYLGVTLDKVAGWNWTAFIHPEDVAGIVAQWRACLATGEIFEYETRVRRANGEYRWMYHHKAPLRNERGNIVKWYGSSLDIDERKSAEQQLRRNATELQRSQFYLAEGQRLGHIGSWAFDPDGFDYWSPELFRMHGLDPASKPPRLQEYLDFLHPHDRQSMADLIKGILAEATPFDATKRVVRPSGEVRYIRCVGAPVVEHRNLKKYVGSAIDVTEHELLTQELRRREAYLTEAQRLSQTGSFGCKVSTGEMFWSEETFRIYGYDRSTQPAVERVLERVHPEDRVLVRERMDQANRDVKDCDVECRLLLPDGSVKHVCIVAHALKNESGATEFIGAVTDVTARRGAEEALRSSEADLLQAQRLSHTGSWRHDVLTGIVTISPEVHRIFDIKPGEGALTAGLFFGRIHTEDRPIEAQNYERANLAKTDFESDYRIVLPDGSIKYVHNIGHPVLSESGDIREFVGTVIDITERKLAEEAMRRSEAYLAEAQRLSHTGSWAWNVRTGALFWSQEIFRIYGYDPQETGPTWEQFLRRVHPEDRAQIEQRAKIETARKEWVDSLGDFRIVLPDGTIKHLHSVAHPARDGSGEITEIIGTVMDVTEHQLLTQELRRREAYLAGAQTLSHTGSFGWNPDTGDLVWSDEAYRIFEYDRSVKPTIDSLVQRVHPEDRAVVKEVINLAIAGTPQFEHAYRLLLPDGRVKYVQGIGHVLQDASGNREFVGAVTDITQQRHAEAVIREQEAELRQMVDFVPQLIAVYGPNRERVYANRTVLDYLGISLDEWRHETFAHSTHPDDSERLKTSADCAFSSGSAYEVELRLHKHDGSYRWFLARYNPVRDDKGQITRWYVTATDIEDRKQAEDRLRSENVALREEIDKASMFEEIVGTSRPLTAVLSRIAKVAPTDSTVLITGETGTGKELIARAIHRRSHRSSRAFVSVNCAAIPRDLIASELFGHEKGAFTGALQRRVGKFELAEGGTIFLDEVGELPTETQIALLRVLQEREFDRVGGIHPIRADVRVIAATNRDLEASIAAGSFRGDLFYRINVFPIEIPPLRQRKDDIPMLVEYFIDRYARKSGKKLKSIDKNTLELLRSYFWPGNIRELQNIIERSVIVCETETFSVDQSWLSLQSSQLQPGRPSLALKSTAQDKQTIEAALSQTQGRVSGPSGAAVLLSVPASTLESKIRALKINKFRFKSA
jgi:PAS domain S-box-containing protein